MNNFRNFRDSGRRDGRRTTNSSSNTHNNRTSTRQIDDLAPKCVRSSFASRFTRSLRRRIPSTSSTSSSSSGSDAGVFSNTRHGRSEENDENVNIHSASSSPISPEPTPVVRPRRRSAAIDRRPTSTSARHPYSYRRSEYLNASPAAVSELQTLFAPDANLVPALSPRNASISFENTDDKLRHNPAEVLADLLQVELDNHRKRSSTASSLYVTSNPRLGPDHSKRVAEDEGEDLEISFFDYDYFFNDSPVKKQKTSYEGAIVRDDEDELDTVLWPPASKSAEPFHGPVSATRAGRDIGFRMAYTLSEDGHDTLGDPRTSWFSDSSYSGSDTDSQDSTDTSSSGSQLSIIRAASLASLREFN